MAAIRQMWAALVFKIFYMLSVELNPGSLAPPPGGDLLHVRAVGDNDTLHFLFCSQGTPALLLVHTNVTFSNVSVDWPRFLSRNGSGSLRVEPASSILSRTALIFSRLRNITWSAMELSGAAARLCGDVAQGSICLHLTVFEREGRDEIWPRLLHTANTSQVAVQLDGLSPRSERSRFFLELQAVGGVSPLNAVEVHRSINDEFTPSVFKVSEWTSGDGSSANERSFVLWKQSGQALTEAGGLALAFFAAEDSVFRLNISFGVADEPFYDATKFLSWTAAVGVGLPPADTFSPLVVAIMAVGLGAPLVMLLMGGVYMCLRKRSPVTGYEPIN
nr:glycosylated lysosomal membrane protein [Syngnathus scovelli]